VLHAPVDHELSTWLIQLTGHGSNVYQALLLGGTRGPVGVNAEYHVEATFAELSSIVVLLPAPRRAEQEVPQEYSVTFDKESIQVLLLLVPLERGREVRRQIALSLVMMCV
jgi:hypothetical protein